MMANLRPSRVEQSNGQTVVVGFDFGTHSTKAVYGLRTSEERRMFDFCERAQGYSSFVAPSLVRLDQANQLWFGGHALKQKEGILFESLKVRLLGLDAEAWQPTFPKGYSPDMLVAAYLAWAFQKVRAFLQSEYSNPRVLLNMSAPMDRLESPKVKVRFLQVAHAAWEMTWGSSPITVEQGTPYAALETRLRGLLEEKTPDETVRRFDVVPETVAAMLSLALDARYDPRMHMIVDIGAGTTEISINHLNEPDPTRQNTRVLCYADTTLPLGANRFAAAAATEVPGASESTEDLLAQILKECQKVWFTGYLKDCASHATRPRWRILRLLLAGGGARRSEISMCIHDNKPHEMCFSTESSYDVLWHQPNIKMLRSGSDKRDLPLLTVAHGLSIERVKWPTLFRPHEIEDLAPTTQIEKGDPFSHIGGR